MDREQSNSATARSGLTVDESVLLNLVRINFYEKMALDESLAKQERENYLSGLTGIITRMINS